MQTFRKSIKLTETLPKWLRKNLKVATSRGVQRNSRLGRSETEGGGAMSRKIYSFSEILNKMFQKGGGGVARPFAPPPLYAYGYENLIVAVRADRRMRSKAQ